VHIEAGLQRRTLKMDKLQVRLWVVEKMMCKREPENQRLYQQRLLSISEVLDLLAIGFPKHISISIS
jgi:hypothetical protein